MAKHEYNFGLFDPATISPSQDFLDFIRDGGWQIRHAVPLSNDLVLLVYEREAENV